jgi:hypothetical protein
VTASSLYHDLKARGVILEARGDLLKVDAPAGVLTEEDKAALAGAKPELLELLSGPQWEAPERESVACWVGPGLIKIRDPFTGAWHEWPSVECLPGVLAEADRLRKGSVT